MLWLFSDLAQLYTILQFMDDIGPQGCLGETGEVQINSWLKCTKQHSLPLYNRAHLATEVSQKDRSVYLTPPSTHLQIRAQHQNRELLLFAEVNL